MRDRRQAVRIVVAITHCRLASHRHRRSPAIGVICIVDGALRRTFLRQPIQSVVRPRDRSVRRVGDLRHAVARIVRVRDRRGVFNRRRLLEPIGYVPLAEYEARYYEQAAVA